MIESLIGLGILGGGGILLIKKEIGEKVGKRIGLGIGLIMYLISINMWIEYIMTGRIEEEIQGIRLGIDGVSIYFVMLTTLLTPICILGMWNKKEVLGEIGLFLILEGLVIGVFTVMNILWFYVCFEGVLIPMYLIIGIWGARERKVKAGSLFIVYTLLGSVLMLLGIIIIYLEIGSLDYETVNNRGIGEIREKILWILFFIGFMVKIPMIPVHLWLPEAHVEAPTEGSVILAGVLLKLGSYGIIRYSVNMFGTGGVYYVELVYVLGMIGIIYASLIAIRQTDIKRIIAYASIAHMNMTIVGVFSGISEGYSGSILQMLSHGIIASGLFICVGILYERMHSRQVWYYSGMIRTMPVFGIVLIGFTMGNIGLPGTSSFIGELMILEGVLEVNKFVGGISALSMVLGGCYSLWLYNRVMFGNYKESGVEMKEITKREIGMVIPLIVLMLVMGLYPSIFLDVIMNDV